jgi:uncharacterized protein (TIGR02118 family)
MTYPLHLEFVAIGNDVAVAIDVAAAVGGTVYVDSRAEVAAELLPFRTLVRAVTDRPALLEPAASVGSYLVCVRPQRVRVEADPRGAVIQINAMFTSTAMTPQTADAHWRDVHAPLALRHHVGMTQYTQLSILHRFDGPAYNGFALCEFDSADDLRDRFFDGPEGRAAILADIAKFADTARSPRRLVARRISVPSSGTS